ncbi:helix-turn-helix domain-containing protein [Daejeonella lutea]|uniref:AraC-type DNA-binding protein n=1 Tax=Daejeonella lutea TaxID=572036 RepID=A0A1T4ZWY2_9SPHI|nr:helix-turn-helix domain-containing protein [Daejeonella lutea]SKB27202.1 AraC-type DNA-binding protein [Daejeonella lutea]
MRFTTIQAQASLQNEVESFIIVENETELPYNVLPDTALVLGFQYKGRLSLISDNKSIPLSASGITGLQNKVRVFRNLEPSGSVLVRFKPGGAAALFALPIHELFEQSIPLDAIISPHQIRIVEEQISEVQTDRERISIIENFLLSIKRKFDTDSLVSAAIQCINESAGNIRIGDLAKLLNSSSSPLEKRFRSVVGCSPKKYASIVRFRRVMTDDHKGLLPSERAYEAGYFDQAHFIKDFKRFTGQTPEHFFSSRSF